MAGIGLNPSTCCCNPIYTCSVRISASFCGTFGYTGRVRISSTTSSFTATASWDSTFNRWNFLVPDAGTYLVESIDAPPDRHDPASRTITATCGGSYVLTFPVASGYRCPSCAPLNPSAPVGSPVRPIPLSLTMTNSRFGDCVITWDPVLFRYFGSKTVTFPASTVAVSGYECPESVGTLDYIWNNVGGVSGSCSAGISGHRGSIPPKCLGDGSQAFNPNSGGFVGTRTDVPLFINTTISSPNIPGLYGDYSGPVTYTITE